MKFQRVFFITNHSSFSSSAVIDCDDTGALIAFNNVDAWFGNLVPNFSDCSLIQLPEYCIAGNRIIMLSTTDVSSTPLGSPSSSSTKELSSIIPIAAGAAGGTLVLILGILGVVLIVRKRRRDPNPPMKFADDQMEVV